MVSAVMPVKGFLWAAALRWRCWGAKRWPDDWRVYSAMLASLATTLLCKKTKATQVVHHTKYTLLLQVLADVVTFLPFRLKNIFSMFQICPWLT